MMKIHEIIRTKRERNKWSLDELAERCVAVAPLGFLVPGRAREWVSWLEDPNVLPSNLMPMDLEVAAKAFGYPDVPDDWYAGAGMMPPDIAKLARDPSKWLVLRAVAKARR